MNASGCNEPDYSAGGVHSAELYYQSAIQVNLSFFKIF